MTGLTRLDDPAPLGNILGQARSLAFNPAGTLLAIVRRLPDIRVFQNVGGTIQLVTHPDHALTLVRLDDAGELEEIVRDDRYPTPAGIASAVCWHPSGRWLLVATQARTYNTNGPNESADNPDHRRVWVFAVDEQTGLPTTGEPVASPVYGPTDTAQLAFSGDGAWLLAGSARPGDANGVHPFDPVTGVIGPAASRFTDEYAANWGTRSVAWRPDGQWAARSSAAGTVSFYFLFTPGSLYPVSTATGVGWAVQWHPGGDYILLGTIVFAFAGLLPVADLTEQLPGLDEGAVAFSGDGRYLAAGVATVFDPALGACGETVPIGLVVLSVDTGGGGFTAAVLDRPWPERQETVSGWQVAWAARGDVLYLAAATIAPIFAMNQWPVLPYEVHGYAVYRIGGGPAGPVSSLYQRDGDGRWVLVGTPGRPLSMRLPDGSLRTWPGSTSPLSMRQPDGSWRQVIG